MARIQNLLRPLIIENNFGKNKQGEMSILEAGNIMKRSKVCSKQLPYPIFSNFEAAIVKDLDI